MSELRDISRRLDDIADYVDGLELSKERLSNAFGSSAAEAILKVNEEKDELQLAYERLRGERVDFLFKIAKLQGSIQVFLLNPDGKKDADRMSILERVLRESSY